MRFGLCTEIKNLELTAKLGFDYIECAVSSITAMTDEEYEKTLSNVKASPVKMERANVLFPAEIKLIGKEADQKTIDEYLNKAFSRVSALGAKVVVFGSGKARQFPVGIPFSESYRELVSVTKRIGELAGKFGITIAIEALNLGESNCINSLKEGAMLEADANMPNVGLLADLYHILMDNESLDNITLVKNLIHTHVALLEGRGYPIKANTDLAAYIMSLKKISYNDTMSIEGRTENLEKDAALGLEVLRSLC